MHVPSPKKLTETPSAVSSPRTSRRYLIWKAAPRPIGIPSPMKAKPPRRPCSLENMCMELLSVVGIVVVVVEKEEEEERGFEVL